MTDLGLRDEETGMSRRGRKGSNSALFARPAYQDDREGLPYGCGRAVARRERGTAPRNRHVASPCAIRPLRGPGKRGFAALTPRLSMVGPLRGPTVTGLAFSASASFHFPCLFIIQCLMPRTLTLNPASTPQADDCRPLRARHVGCGRWRSSCSPRRSCCERRHVHNSRHRHQARRPRG